MFVEEADTEADFAFKVCVDGLRLTSTVSLKLGGFEGGRQQAARVREGDSGLCWKVDLDFDRQVGTAGNDELSRWCEEFATGEASWTRATL